MGRIVTKTETIQGQTDSYSYGYDTTGRLAAVSKSGLSIAQYTYDSNADCSLARRVVYRVVPAAKFYKL